MIFNKINLYIAALLLLFFLLRPQSAMAIENCTIDEALSRLTMFQVKQAAENAEAQRPILNRMIQLTAQATNNNLPIGAQLNDKDRKEFDELSFKLLNLNLRTAFLENLQRDTEVIANVVRVGSSTLQGKLPDKNSKDSEYYLLMAFVWANIPDLEFTRESQNNGCSMVSALENYEDNIVKNIDMNKVNQMSSEVRSIQDKYHLGSAAGWLERMPNGADKVRATQIDESISKFRSQFDFLKTLEKIKLVQKLSDRQLSLLTTALNKAKAKSDLDKIAAVYDQVADPNSDVEKKAMEILNYITQKYPSDGQKLRDELNKPLIEKGLIPNN